MPDDHDIMRCQQGGWIRLGEPDGRRGVWMRVTKDAIEFCAGREGDDDYVRLAIGEKVSRAHIDAFDGIALAYMYALDLAAQDALSAYEASTDCELKLGK